MSTPLRRVISTLRITNGPKSVLGQHDLLECGHTVIQQRSGKTDAPECHRCEKCEQADG